MKKLLLTVALLASFTAKEGMAQKALRPEQMAQFELARQHSEEESAVALIVDNQTDKNFTLQYGDGTDIEAVAANSKSKRIFLPLEGQLFSQSINVFEKSEDLMSAVIKLGEMDQTFHAILYRGAEDEGLSDTLAFEPEQSKEKRRYQVLVTLKGEGLKESDIEIEGALLE